MAEKTPDSRQVLSMGDHRLLRLIYTSTTLDDGDTYTSAIKGIVDQWFNQTDDPTAQAAAGMSVSEASKVFTFRPGENGATGTLYVITKT